MASTITIKNISTQSTGLGKRSAVKILSNAPLDILSAATDIQLRDHFDPYITFYNINAEMHGSWRVYFCKRSVKEKCWKDLCLVYIAL